MSQPSVILCGGGETPPALVGWLLRLAGGVQKRIVILAHTQHELKRGGYLSAQLFRQHGAQNVQAVDSLEVSEVVQAIQQAQGVWIPGGDQSLFMQRIGRYVEVRRALQDVLARGGVVGGTSAGASLMGTRMPTGEPQAGMVPTAQGLSLLPNALVDQHLLTRKRLQRLLEAILQHYPLIGIGLDEGAWVTVRSGKVLEVFSGQVVIVQATTTPLRRGGAFSVRGVRIDLLAPGDRREL